MADASTVHTMEALTISDTKPRSDRASDGNATKSTLFTLPRELRDLIFGYLLEKPTNTITMLSDFKFHTRDISARPPAICFVNRQIRAEALPMFYATNTFTALLDNKPDLATSRAWLSAIGSDNVGSLRRIIMCGWTRVPFGHMISRRWVRIALNLREGVMETVSEDGLGAMKESTGQHPEVTSSIEELQAAFKKLFDARDGEPFDRDSLEQLMEGFHLLCTGY